MQSTDEPAAALSREALAKVSALRTQLQLNVGQLVLAALHAARYRHLPISDLEYLLIEPLLKDRVAIAYRQSDDGNGGLKVDEAVVSGIALWASVSDAVDARITEQVQANVFPVRLAPDDWNSGENVWLLDVLAADRMQATVVLGNFRQVCGDKSVKIHPHIGRLIDPEAVAQIIRTYTQSDQATQFAERL